MNIMKTTNGKNLWGFVVPATLFNLTAGGFLVVAAGSFSLCGMPKLAAMASYPALNSQNQDATTLITRDLRQASSLKQASQDCVVLNCQTVNGSSLVTYTYNAAAHTLTRTDEHSTQTILTGLDGFSFSFFQRPALAAAYDTFAPATAQNAKMVSCRWSCSKKVAGNKVDSENIELAPILLRNHC